MPIFGFRLELRFEGRQLRERGVGIRLLTTPVAASLPHPWRPIFIAPISTAIPISAFAPPLLAATARPVGRIARLAPLLAIAAGLLSLRWGRRRSRVRLRRRGRLRHRLRRFSVARRPPPARPSLLR